MTQPLVQGFPAEPLEPLANQTLPKHIAVLVGLYTHPQTGVKTFVPVKVDANGQLVTVAGA